jgi:hypothetical protein
VFRRIIGRARRNLRRAASLALGKRGQGKNDGIIIQRVMKSTVRALFVCPEKKARPVALAEARLGPAGFEGDFHKGADSRRQILMLSDEVLREFDLAPGMLSENVVIDGFDVMSLAPGQQLRIGEAVLEVTVPCEPCIQMERIRRGLKRGLEGKRGMFARVLTPGTIRVGDPVMCP